MSNGGDSASIESSVLPVIGLTIGDPAGIGPEISLKAAFSRQVLAVCRPVLIGDARYLRHRARRLGLDDRIPVLAADAGSAGDLRSAADLPDDRPLILQPRSPDPDLVETIIMGREQALAGQAAAAQIELAVDLCRRASLDAMATAPINKQSLRLAGIPFPGHTEYLAHLTSCDDYAMAFFSPRLRVALLTIHVALAAVPQLVRRADLDRLIRLVDRELKSYRLASPRIAVAGLNPHAGEGGLFGNEEAREIAPAIADCQRDNIRVDGPLPADTVFLRAVRGEFDIVISCYHDQGLIPIKCFSFGEAVNVTLGLPIIRTSVDHGTAFDIAGRGCADESSMIAAVRLAAELSAARSMSVAS